MSKTQLARPKSARPPRVKDPHPARTQSIAAMAAARELQQRALAELERLGGVRSVIAKNGSVLGPATGGWPVDPFWRHKLAGLSHAEAVKLATSDPDPLSVLVRGGKITLIAGNHRFEALLELGVASVPAHVRLEHTSVGVLDIPLAVPR
jgi:hypothetical protein